MNNGASRANRLRASVSVRTAVFYGATLCCSVGTLSTCCVGRLPFCSAGVAPLRNVGRRSTMLCCRSTRLTAELLGKATITHSSSCQPCSLAHYCCRVNLRMVRPTAAIVTMVDPVANAGVADTLETRLADARKCHADGEYGTIPLLIVELGIRSQSCRERLDAGHQAWHFILSTYQVRDDLYIAQLEEKMTHIRMGEQESATDYCNRARRILAEMRMAGAEYLTASYISHIMKGLLRGYNLMKRMMMEAEQPTELLPQVNYAAPTKLNQQHGQRRKPGGGGSGGGRSTMDVNEKRSTRDKGRGGGGHWRECWICHDPDHLSYECLDCDDNDEDDTEGSPGRSTSRRPRRDAKPRKQKQTSKKTSSNKDVDNSSGKSRGDGEASCSVVGVAELTVSLAPEAGEDFQAVAAAMQANSMAVLLDSGCSHHLMGTKAVFVNMAPSNGVKHVRGFNGALQHVEGRGTVALQGEARKRVLIPDVLYVPGIQANLLSASQRKESGVQLQGNGEEMLLVAATGEVIGRARYNGRVLYTDLRPCSMRPRWWLYGRSSRRRSRPLTGCMRDSRTSTRAITPWVSCVGGKLARHTFPDKGSDAEEALAVVHIDLCGPFWVVAKDGSLFFLLLKDRHTRFVPGRGVPREGVHRLIDGKGIAHDLTCPYTPQQNGMAEREMRTAVESVRTMLLHMDVQHHWWHLALRQAVWVRNYLERSTTPPGTTLYQVLTGKKPDLTLARVWGCMVQFMVPEQQRGGKLAMKARWGVHLGVSPESKGWEVLDLTDNKVVTSVEVIFYETLSLEVWKAKFGPASGRTQAHPPTNTSTATVPLLAEVDEPADEDVVEVLLPPLVLAPPFPVADRPASTPMSATGDEGSLEVSLVAPASGIADGRQGAKLADQDGKSLMTGEQQTGEPVVLAGEQLRHAEDLPQHRRRLRPQPDAAGHEERFPAEQARQGALHKSQVNEALYFKVSDDGVTCWVLVYVDDLLPASSSPAMLKELKQLLEDVFELREISPVVKYLGLEIVRDRPAKKLWLHQQGYADKLRRRFIDEEQGGRVPKTPVSVDAYAELTFDDEEAQEHEEEEYQQKVGSLQFAATTTRPDIAFACSKLGSSLTVRSNQHWREVNRCLAYLADTRDTALEFGGGPESLEKIGYVDADDAGNKQKRMSTSGYVFVYGGAAVSWSSSRIKCATLSSSELEYVAATNVGKEGRRLRFFLAEFKLLDAGKPTILRVDNKSAITVAAGLGLTGNLKHMERRYAWLQHMVRREKFVLQYILTTEQPADFLTKALHFPDFNRCSVAISKVRLADVGDGDDDVQQ
ncbi:unnamed protein product [Closterium sp. NIES-54]